MVKVELVAHTPDPQRTIAAAAKLCYSPSGAMNIKDGLSDEKVEAFLQKLESFGHDSPVEHVSFTFAVEGISRSLLAQLTRHRIASFSVQSQRYVKQDRFCFITPPEIAQNDVATPLYTEAMNASWRYYEQLTEVLYNKHLEQFLQSGIDEKTAKSKAQKTAIEDARYVLPNACETKLMMTMNVRSLRNFFGLRCCNRAQWEIKEMAWQMLDLCKSVAPALFAKSGPSCVAGKCGEGAMTCGKAGEINERYKKLG